MYEWVGKGEAAQSYPADTSYVAYGALCLPDTQSAWKGAWSDAGVVESRHECWGVRAVVHWKQSTDAE